MKSGTHSTISISGRFLRVERPTGTQRSARCWIEATLPYLKNVEVFVPECDLPDWNVHFFKRLPNRAMLDHLWEQLIFPTAASGILWTLMGTGPVIHPGRRHIMIVHDLNFLIIPEVFSPAFRRWYAIACAEAAKRADVLVVFTEYVKRTLVERLDIPSSKIHVIPQGPGLKNIAQSDEVESGRQASYFLCVGSLQPHKNLNRILVAWKEFYRRNPDLTLKVVGRPQAGFTRMTVEQVAGVEYTGYVSDAELIRLYKGALGFIYPSLEEGFGMPVVESFYCGCPVVTSNKSCLPEVAGDAALLVNPFEVDDIKAAFEKLAADVEYRRRLRKLGARRANAFRWDRAGAEMAKVLLEVGGERR